MQQELQLQCKSNFASVHVALWQLNTHIDSELMVWQSLCSYFVSETELKSRNEILVQHELQL